MYLKKLSLVNFKNYEQAQLQFCPTVNCITGNNGEGKTNILDAIHYLSVCKSYFNPADTQNIKHDQQLFVIQGEFSLNEHDNTEIYCAQKKGQKKIFRKNKKDYEKLADHIGLIPLIMISPSDTDLITDGSEIRRKFIDSIISQYNKLYLDKLIEYNKTLVQRNMLLKQFAEKQYFNKDLLEVYDEQLSSAGQFIYAQRVEFINSFTGLFAKYYAYISNSKEQVNIEYKSDLYNHNMNDLLSQSLSRDRATQYTQAGIHKDDLLFTMNGSAIKKFGSQGQQKSFLIALKLAQYFYIKSKKNVLPILLLDDIFDKLDDLRVDKLMQLVTQNDFGQVFITDTSYHRLSSILNKTQINYKHFLVSNGIINETQYQYTNA
jgi:DNA replication and repair protein RecF